MRRSGFVILAMLAALQAAPAGAADATRSPLHGTLEPGPHAVGFTRIELADSTRALRPQPAGADAASAGRPRRMEVYIWYPAAPGSTVAPITFADAMVSHMQSGPADWPAQEANVRQFLSQFGQVSDEGWARLKGTRLLARPDAPAASGRFPLLIGALRPLSTAITNEYLASHGFVVAMVDGENVPDPPDPGGALEIDYRDMEFAIPELRKRQYVDERALGALGFSGSGFSQLLLAMRHPDVQAVCDLESAIFDDRMMYPLFRGWGYSTTALRVPFLHTYSLALSKRENRIKDFEAMRYSTRYRYLVDAPNIHHWDFATEGMAASAVLGNRGKDGPRLQQAFEATNRYVLQFFNAYLKHDRNALAFLRRQPEENGVPAGLVSIRELASITPAPTFDEMIATIRKNGVDAALKSMESAKTGDPQAALFQEAPLNRLGYFVMRTRTPADSLPIFRKIVEWYPSSSNAYDSLGEALERAGEKQAALEVTQKGLEVLAKQDLTADERRDMADLLEGRLKRLK